MHQIQFRLGLRPDPAGRTHSVPADPLAGFKGPILRGGEEKEGVEGGEGSPVLFSADLHPCQTVHIIFINSLVL